MDDNAGRFTSPSHRGTKRTASSSTAVVPWTASRCNRILRPLISKVTALQKNKQRYGDLRIVPKPQDNTFPFINKIRVISGGTKLAPASNTTAEIPIKLLDDDWKPDDGKAQPRIKRTYTASSRQRVLRRRESSSERAAKRVKMPSWSGPASVDPTTPRINLDLKSILSFINEGIETESKDGSSSETASGKFPWTRGLNQVMDTVRTSERELNQGISSALRELLRVTRSPEKESEEGRPRSLLSTCLGRLADQISEEQLGQKVEGGDAEEDVQSIIYTDLESLGWNSMRELVREHGIHIIGNAIKHGLIQSSFVQDLVSQCTTQSADKEGAYLYECHLATLLPLPQPRTFIEPLFWAFEGHPAAKNTNVLLHDSTEGCANLGRNPMFIYGYLATMFETQNMPIEWIMTKHMVPVFDSVIRTLTQNNEHSSTAYLFLKRVLLAGVGISAASVDDDIHKLRVRCYRGDKGKEKSRLVEPTECPVGCDCLECKHRPAVTETYINLITVVLSISVVRGEVAKAKGVDLPIKLTELLGEVAQEVLRIRGTFIRDEQGAKPRLPPDRLSILLLAAGLENLSRADESRQETLQSEWLDAIAETIGKDGTDMLSKFLCTLSFCCSSAGSQHVFQYLKNLAGTLADISKDRGQTSTARRLSATVAVDAALEYADMTQSKKHLNWALDLEETCGLGEARWSPQNRFSDANQTPNMRLHAGFRWEEGICEWIKKTPLAPFEKKLQTAARLHKVERLQVQTSHHIRCKSLGREIEAFVIPYQATDIHGRPILVETKANSADRQLWFGNIEPRTSGGHSSSSESDLEDEDEGDDDQGGDDQDDDGKSDDSDDDNLPNTIPAQSSQTVNAALIPPSHQAVRGLVSAANTSPSGASSADELSTSAPFYTGLGMDGASDNIDELSAAPAPVLPQTSIRLQYHTKRKRSRSGTRRMLDLMESSEDELVFEPGAKRKVR